MEEVARPYTQRGNVNIDAGGKRTIEEVGFHNGDYGTWFADQDRAWRVKAAGPGRVELLDSGEVEFHDLVDAQGNLRTLKELRGGGAPSSGAFAASKTVGEAEEWAKSKVAANADYRRASVEIADAVNTHLEKRAGYIPGGRVERVTIDYLGDDVDSGVERGTTKLYANSRHKTREEWANLADRSLYARKRHGAVGNAPALLGREKYLEGVLDHEVGHMVYSLTLTPQQKAAWNSLATRAEQIEWKISVRTLANIEEHFSEAFVLYVNGMRNKLHPDILSFFDRLKYREKS